ncbi:hypothetical protein U9M48_041172 [Paspalum notatum var. saurae]|uniref:Uncharacterized protein n=1 Tax=Paspalum notatum var. saurae TaxID=547442 RepID=A0AAQ3UPS2_PASNO
MGTGLLLCPAGPLGWLPYVWTRCAPRVVLASFRSACSASAAPPVVDLGSSTANFPSSPCPVHCLLCMSLSSALRVHLCRTPCVCFIVSPITRLATQNR